MDGATGWARHRCTVNMSVRSAIILGAFVICGSCSAPSTADPRPPDSNADAMASDPCNVDHLSDFYDQYVEPFVSGTVSSSCSQCHMTGIDISLYAQDTPCQTMACMVELGAVDLQRPAESSLLTQILLGDPNSSVFDVGSEHAAMLEWIEWSAMCHGDVCGSMEAACTTGTGAESTGTNPIGDCSEEDLLLTFWDSVIVDRGRCLLCHSDFGVEENTYGPCATDDDCVMGRQLCREGRCRANGPVLAPNFFEGAGEPLRWDDPADRRIGLNTMYNMIALGLMNEGEPLDSLFMTKPLLQDFQPTAIYGPGVNIDSVAAGTGVGAVHGGSSKFHFDCFEEPCPTSGVIDCRVETSCEAGMSCPDGLACSDGYCRQPGSYCDSTYVAFVRFAQYFAECRGD